MLDTGSVKQKSRCKFKILVRTRLLYMYTCTENVMQAGNLEPDLMSQFYYFITNNIIYPKCFILVVLKT